VSFFPTWRLPLDLDSGPPSTSANRLTVSWLRAQKSGPAGFNGGDCSR